MPIHRQMLARRISRTDAVAAPESKRDTMQVRSVLSARFAPHMRAIDVSAPAISRHKKPNRDGFDGFVEELLRKRVVISPVVVTWRYEIVDDGAFLDWLAAREVLLSELRMSGDAELKGIRYAGTYRLSDDEDAVTSTYKTIWGFTNEAAMRAMHRLCSAEVVQATLVQLELIDFVKGLRTFIALAGEEKFSQEVMVSAAMAQA